MWPDSCLLGVWRVVPFSIPLGERRTDHTVAKSLGTRATLPGFERQTHGSLSGPSFLGGFSKDDGESHGKPQFWAWHKVSPQCIAAPEDRRLWFRPLYHPAALVDSVPAEGNEFPRELPPQGVRLCATRFSNIFLFCLLSVNILPVFSF